MQKGLMHYIYGNGPGKTRSSFGIVIRSIGHNHKPIIIQFLKQSSDYPENERAYLERLLIDLNDLLDKYKIENAPSTSYPKGFTYGEYLVFTKLLKVPVIQIGKPTFLLPHQKPSKEYLTKFKFGMELIERILNSEVYHLVVLDEINTAVKKQLVDLNQLIHLLRNRSPQIEVILTGREKIPELVEIADYVTQIVEEKHPFTKGIQARIGVEY
ncbi:MAG: cob(I)yrinic acid a,c-diamide adenosyltransferase [Candidatus Lokiarchaeota archaeon]|nr:cob(I)yrinic acid a,c-diamide adenosyltransferase [Candidatus Lokiarchaeota archaeon]